MRKLDAVSFVTFVILTFRRDGEPGMRIVSCEEAGEEKDIATVVVRKRRKR